MKEFSFTLHSPTCRILAILALCFTSHVDFVAQNLAPNPSFEDFTVCPANFGAPGAPLPSEPWICATLGSCDYFHVCGVSPNIQVPNNFFGTENAHTGSAYAGGYASLAGFEYREYLMAPLTEPLVAGAAYSVSFYWSLSDNTCGIISMGAHFTSTLPPNGGLDALDFLEPQVVNTTEYMSKKDGWSLFSKCFIAEGGETHIIIGNFENDSETSVDPSCTPFTQTSYYYIDDVSVVETVPGDLEVELDGPIVACDEYTIDPGFPGHIFIWSDGSTGSTLTVTESGTYSVTISNGCSQGEDEIDVTIEPSFTVDVGPDQVILCDDETYTIDLDPSLGDYTWQDGANDASYTISEGGIYQVTLDDGCQLTTDLVEVTHILEPAPFDLGPDTYFCDGEEIVFMFDPGLGDFEWQDGATTQTYTLNEGGTYALTISNVCGEQTDEIEIEQIFTPDVDLGPDTMYICEGEFVEFEVDPEMGDITWLDGSSDPIVIYNQPGNYGVQIVNECGIASDIIHIAVTPVPEFEFGPDINGCEGETYTLMPDIVPGTYTWQDNSDEYTYTITTSGTYSLTVVNQCGTFTDEIDVNLLNAVLPPDLGADVNLCPGESIALDVTSPDALYQWNTGSTSPVLDVTTSGTYIVTVYNACSSFSDTIQVNVQNEPPDVQLAADFALCTGQSFTIESGIGGVSYSWNDGSTNPNLTVTTPGIYSLTVSNACGNDADTLIVTNGGPAPLVDLGIDTSICNGTSFTLTPSFSDVSNWSWSDGSNGSSVIINQHGEVYVNVSNSCGTSTDTIEIGLWPDVPSLNLGVDTALCSFDALTLTISIPDVDIVWNDDSTNPDYTIASPGTYYATISNICGSSADTIVVTPLPDIPSLSLGNDQSLCPGEQITLDPAIPNVSYLWQDGSTNPVFSTTLPGEVILIISNDCGSATDTVQIVENANGPQLNLGPDTTACEGETIVVQSGISGVQYLWQDGSTGNTYTASVSETVHLLVSNLCGTDRDTLVVTIEGQAPTPALGPDTSLCEGAILTLHSTAATGTDILWSTGSTNTSINVSIPGIYAITETNVCGTGTDEINIEYTDAPDPFSLGSDTVLCPFTTLTLTAPATSFQITWQDGSNGTTFVVDQAGTYTLDISNECGTESSSVDVTIDTRSPSAELPTPVLWCPGETIDLDVSQTFSASYEWSTGATSPAIIVTTPGTYSVSITVPCSTVVLESNVENDADCDANLGIFIPNVISPNSDGQNDVFTLYFGSDIQVLGINGTILDRWGNLVFQSTDDPFIWNGRFNEEDVMPGVYVYMIKVRYDNGLTEREEILSGDVTIVR